MRQLIPESILQEYKVLFLSILAIDEWHLTKVEFSSLPEFSISNRSIRADYIQPVSFRENEESALLVMDKISNHSLYSLMITQSGKSIKKGFQELTEFEVRTLFEIYVQFIDWYMEQGIDSKRLLPRFNYNHDPYTTERPGLQSIERFHAHLYLLQQEELSLQQVFLLKDLYFHPSYKDYYDPAAYCFEQVLLDLHQKFIKVPSELELISESLADKVRNGRGLGLNIFYRGSVSYFKSKGFIEYIQSLHREAERVFSEIVNHCGFPKSIDKKRVEAFISESDWMSMETKSHLKDLLTSLKELSPKLISFLQRKQKQAKNILAYKFFCYSFSIDLISPNEYLLNFYPRLFSEIGGAGIFASAGYNAIVIERNKKSYFTSQEIEARRAFQKGFLGKLTLSK